MTDTKHLLIIGSVWPEPDSSAAGSRMMQLIDLFQKSGWNITFSSSAVESPYQVDLSAWGIDTAQVAVNDSEFDTFVQQLNPDAVIFDRFMTEEKFGWRVAEHYPGALRILDTEDLHCLRKARRKAVHEERKFSEKDLLAEEVAIRELASIYRSDLSLIISEAEMKLLRNFFQVDKSILHYLPFLLDPVDEKHVENWPNFDSRRHFVTIGNFRHPPNWDAVLYLKRIIWPRIRKKLPEAELHIYGSYPSQKVWQLHKQEEGFCIKGRAESAAEVVSQARVCLAPLRFGAGLKGKLVEAMQCGTPSVTTPIGAEGLSGSLNWSGIIADQPADFANAAVKLYTDISRWKNAQQQGIKIINQRFNKSRFSGKITEHVYELMQNLQDHRLKNFTGRMLRHHSMNSTKYMSRWIEAKNKV